MQAISSFNSLELQLLGYGYHKCVFIELYCPRHGAWRIGLADDPASERHPCPECHALVASSPALCCGFTRKPLPVSEFVNGRCLHWDEIKDETDDWKWERAKARRKGGRKNDPRIKLRTTEQIRARDKREPCSLARPASVAPLS